MHPHRIRFCAKHFKMVLVSSSSDSDDDDDESSETLPDTSKPQPRAELAQRASAGKSKDSSGWVKAGSKILSMVRDSSVDSPKSSKTTSLRRRDDLPATVLSLAHKGKKHMRGHDSQTTKHTSHRLSVTSFSSDESSSDDEKEMRVASVDSERIERRGSSTGLKISIKAGKFANGRCFRDKYLDV